MSLLILFAKLKNIHSDHSYCILTHKLLFVLGSFLFTLTFMDIFKSQTHIKQVSTTLVYISLQASEWRKNQYWVKLGYKNCVKIG